MREVYTIPMAEKETIDKAIARFTKKASAYGKMLSVENSAPYAKERTIFREDDSTNTAVKDRTELVEVYDLTIDSEIIRKDGYSIVAKLEHLENGNFVYSFVDEPDPSWQTQKPYCQHCGTKHYRKNTFIVRHENGSEKQVGSTCLKDYCGIDPQCFVAMKQLRDLFIRNDISIYDFDRAPRHVSVYHTVEMLALAYDVYKRQGYKKSDEPGSNKSVLFDMIAKKISPTDEGLSFAEQMRNSILAMKRDESISKLNMKVIWFENSIKPLIDNGYCKSTHFGYIAYAPVEFDRYLEAVYEEEKRKRQISEQAASSSYIGEVGEKISVDISSMKLLTSWESDWGYTYLYKIIDTAGNVLVWYASKCVDTFNRMRATVKAHNEREGVKQTVVTRCRAI